jgi:hypothetical protein
MAMAFQKGVLCAALRSSLSFPNKSEDQGPRRKMDFAVKKLEKTKCAFTKV